jgi:hypothetical protein
MDNEAQVLGTQDDVFRSTVRGAEPITTVTTNSNDAGVALDRNEVPEWDEERFGRHLTKAVEKAFGSADGLRWDASSYLDGGMNGSSWEVYEIQVFWDKSDDGIDGDGPDGGVGKGVDIDAIAQEAADRAWGAKVICDPEFGAQTYTRAQDQEGWSGEGSLEWSDDVFYSNLEGYYYHYDVKIEKYDDEVWVCLSGRFWSDEDIGDPGMSPEDADQFIADLEEMLQRAANEAWVRKVPDGAGD